MTTFIACFREVTTLRVKKRENWETQDFQQVYWFKIIYQKSIFEIEYTSLKDVKHVITSIYY